MAYERVNYQPGDVLTADQMNKIQDEIINNNGNIESHIDNKENPHGVTAAQVGAASGGYGLGTNCASIDSVTNITASGWYKTSVETPSSGEWLCQAFTANDGADVIVEAWSINGRYKAKRAKVSGVWDDWEWFNPQLSPGTEYRTTETHYSRSVFCKAVDFGTGPNNTTKTVEHNCSDIKNVVEWHAYNVSTGTNIEQATNITAVTVDKTKISVTTKANETSMNFRFIIKYTKDNVS